MTNRAPESEVLLRESLALARAAADTSLQIQVLNVLAYVVRVQGKREESRSLYRDQLAMATAIGNRPAQASAMQTLADDELDAGRFDVALEQFHEVLAMFEEAGDTLRMCSALLRIGGCEAEMGHLEKGRDVFEQCAALALGRPGFERIELAARSNVAQVNMDLGDPGPALAEFERNYAIERRIGSLLTAANTASNIAEARLDLGQPTAAAEVIEELLPVIRAAKLESQEVLLQIALGSVREHQQRFADAADIYRGVLALPPDRPVEPKIHAIRGLARCLSAQDSGQVALALLRGALDLRDQGTKKAQVLFDQDLAEALMDADRPDDALAVLRRIDREADEIELDRFRVGALTRAAICSEQLARPDSALALYERASRLWERERTVPVDAEWRALRSTDAYLLGTRYASLVLEHPALVPAATRRREAFDILQRFKARTLLERMVFPGDDLEQRARPPVVLDEVQDAVLRPGELLLDVFAGEPVLMAAVTRDTCRILRIAGDEEEIQDQVDLIRKLVAAPARDLEGIASVTDAMSKRLLSDVADLLDRADRVLFAPGGSTNLLPLGLLFRPDDPQQRPLVETHAVMRIPSATSLAWVRRRGAGSAPPRPHKVVAIAGARAEGQSRLPGAAAEVRDLARRYRDVEIREPTDAAATVAVLNELGQFEVVHVSAHTDLDDERPWRSGIVLGVGDPTQEPAVSNTVLRSGGRPGELMLRASDISSLDLGTSLAVLSACETAGGKIVSGEGVQGLTTAFLGAGVRSVVATLWPVDDASTARWVGSFYRALADGLPAAAAVQRASLELRVDPSTSDPFHWAGFVLVGDGDTRVSLEHRASLRWPWLAGAVVLIAAFGAVGLRRRRARTV